MRKTALILSLIFVVGSTLGQTFETFKGLIDFNKKELSEKESFLTDNGYVNTGSGSFESKEATDTVCDVWLSSDSMEIVKVNSESFEYKWLYGERHFNVEVNKLFDNYMTDISTSIFDTKRKYLFLKRKRGIRFASYDNDYDEEFRPYDYSYLKGEDTYVRSKLWLNHVFVGSISE